MTTPDQIPNWGPPVSAKFQHYVEMAKRPREIFPNKTTVFYLPHSAVGKLVDLLDSFSNVFPLTQTPFQFMAEHSLYDQPYKLTVSSLFIAELVFKAMDANGVMVRGVMYDGDPDLIEIIVDKNTL